MSIPKADIRPRRSMALFALFAIFMVITSYLFVLLLAVACVYVPYLILLSSKSPEMQSTVLFLFGIVIAAAMLWSLVPRRDNFEPPGMLLDRATQARLFAELEAIANALDEPLPREVYLIGDVNAFVADRGGFMGLGSRRVMGLGLPLLSILTVSQFRAVLAHEFAHYYGGDTSLGPWVYKTKMSIIRVFENIGSVGQLARIAVLGLMHLVVTNVLKWYFLVFLRVINFVSRRQEYRADELACLVAGRQALVDGLLSIQRAALAWPAYWSTELRPALSEGSLPAIADGFALFVAAPDISEKIEKKIEEERHKSGKNPYDTHPPLEDRVAAAQRLTEGLSPSDLRPACALLDNVASVELQFIENRIPELRAGALKYVTWNDVAVRVAIPSWEKFLRENSTALQGVTAETLPEQIPKLPAIGSTIPDPKGMLLAPEQRTQRAGQLLAVGLALALIRAGWELQMQPGVFQIRLGNQQLNPFLLVNQLMTGKLSPGEWADRCRQLAISQLPLLVGNQESRSQPSQLEQPGLFGSEAGVAS